MRSMQTTLSSPSRSSGGGDGGESAIIRDFPSLIILVHQETENVIGMLLDSPHGTDQRAFRCIAGSQREITSFSIGFSSVTRDVASKVA
jgi:hypothetical protein